MDEDSKEYEEDEDEYDNDDGNKESLLQYDHMVKTSKYTHTIELFLNCLMLNSFGKNLTYFA